MRKAKNYFHQTKASEKSLKCLLSSLQSKRQIETASRQHYSHLLTLRGNQSSLGFSQALLEHKPTNTETHYYLLDGLAYLKNSFYFHMLNIHVHVHVVTKYVHNLCVTFHEI